ncbi:hypothetical protein K7432_011484 [Basidiobolus ranarum]|uniref:Amidohydrolase-related domain-containing protein n=1 Tax=Basidiobolus ranarum TaxID=34480 RepID=A0ABR2VTT0_9FUNG
MSFTNLKTVFKGTLIHAPSKDKLDILENHICGVNQDGKIEIIEPISSEKGKELLDTIKDSNVELIEMDQTQFLIPGFIDTHHHAPQYPYTGTACETPLFDWLNKYAFNYESKFKELTFARAVYSRQIRRALKNGTTTGLYFLTIDLKASELFVELLEEYGMRGFVGIPSLDQHGSAVYSCETENSIRDVEAFVEFTLGKGNPLITPVVTPRFIPTCSNKLLQALGDIAERYNLPIQSHISESIAEVDFVHQLHDGKNDADVFDSYKLLNNRTVLAHGTRLVDADLEILKSRGAAISHCPLSNSYFGNGSLSVKKLWRSGVKCGLGTDIAGGYSISMLSAIRQAVITSRFLEVARLEEDKTADTTDSNSLQLNYKEAFWLATMGGAESLGIHNDVGSFEVGKSLDALLVDLSNFEDNESLENPIELFVYDTIEDAFQKFIHVGDDRNIKEIWVQGRKIQI